MTAFVLSKPFIDVGLFTNAGDAMRSFYSDEIGLPFIDNLQMEPGYLLSRYNANGSALKINEVDTPLPARATHYVRMLWPEPGLSAPRQLHDPDGNELELVPRGHLDIDQLGIVYRVPSLSVAADFAERALGAERLGEGRYRFGRTVLLFEVAPTPNRAGPLEALGFTYTTLHVMDVVSAHAHLIANGCAEAIPPTPYHGITTYSFARDAVGNWIEISQRADLTGSVAQVDGPVLSQAEVIAIRRRG
jgi:hypothetical protein